MTKIVQEDINRIANTELSWDKLVGKTVMVTGATGFIGSFVTCSILERVRLTGEKIYVIALIRNLEKAKKVFAGYGDFVASGILKFVIADVMEPITEDVHSDYVVHCVSNTAPDQYAADPSGTIKLNMFGTMHMLDYAKKTQACKFLYVSTIEIYGKTDSMGMISENDYGYISSTVMRSCYPESKKACENLTICYGNQYGLDVSVGRLSYIYGAGMNKNDSKVCAVFARRVAAGEDLILKSNGAQIRSYTYVSDAISGLLKVLTDGENGEAYNIASSSSVITISDMAHQYCALFPEQNSKVVYDTPGEYEKKSFSFITNAVMDSEKLENLGWKGAVSLEEGMRRTVLDCMEVMKTET